MFVQKISDFLWGAPLIIILILGGIYLSLRLGFPQIRLVSIFKSAKATLFHSCGEDSGISSFQCFATSLAATVGTGSVVGVGAALAAGGAGSIFWMWVCAFIGMGISYCENYLGVKYSHNDKIGGAVSYLEKIGRGKIIAVTYGLFSVFASLGMGNMAQANTISQTAKTSLGIPIHLTAAALVIFAAVTVCDSKRTAKICSGLVPFMALLFCIGSLVIILTSPVKAANALKEIFYSALSPKAIAGGALGSVITEGLKRGAFSNEAGLGSTAAIHSSADLKSPEAQGTLAMAEVFIDTIVICTLTALVILISGTDTADLNCAVKAYGAAFNIFGKLFIAVCLILFASATIAGWFFVGEKSWRYLFPKHGMIYKCLYIFCVFLGAMYSPELIWGISDIFNALMAIPNMMGVLLLSKEIRSPFTK